MGNFFVVFVSNFFFAVYWRNMDNFHKWVASLQGENLFNPGWVETSSVVAPSQGKKCRAKLRKTTKKSRRRPKKSKKNTRAKKVKKSTKAKKVKRSRKTAKKSAPKTKKTSSKKSPKKTTVAKKLSPCQKAALKQKARGKTALQRGHYIKGKCHAKTRKFHYAQMSHCWRNKDYCHFVEPVKQECEMEPARPRVIRAKKVGLRMLKVPKKKPVQVKQDPQDQQECRMEEQKPQSAAQRLMKEIRG